MAHSFPHPGLSLRNWQPEDKTLEFEIYAASREDEMQAWGFDAQQKQLFLQMQFDAQQRGHRGTFPQAQTQIILQAEQPIGRLCVDRTGDAWTVVDIALLSAYRGQGIGSSLLQALQNEAGEQGHSVQLQVWKENRARRLYQRLGFQICGDDGVYFQMEWHPPTDETQVKERQGN